MPPKKGEIMKKLLIILVATCLSTSAMADLLIEPYAGFGFGSLENNKNALHKYTVSFAPTIGGRLGWEGTFLFAAVDYMIQSGTYEGDTSLVDNIEVDFTTSMFAAAVGLDVPVLPIRFWGKYIFSRDTTVESTTGDIDYSGDGYGIGAGFTGLPFLSINLEYLMTNYDEKDSESVDYDVNTVLFSLSIPFSI